MATNTPAVLPWPSASTSKKPRPWLPPTNSPTVTPITARVEAIRRPENSAAMADGNSTRRKICQRLAFMVRTRLIMSGSTVRIAESTLIITGKNTIRMAIRIFG